MKEVAAITGGSQGLGLACVERLVKDGYEVRPQDKHLGLQQVRETLTPVTEMI